MIKGIWTGKTKHAKRIFEIYTTETGCIILFQEIWKREKGKTKERRWTKHAILPAMDI